MISIVRFLCLFMAQTFRIHLLELINNPPTDLIDLSKLSLPYGLYTDKNLKNEVKLDIKRFSRLL